MVDTILALSLLSLINIYRQQVTDEESQDLNMRDEITSAGLNFDFFMVSRTIPEIVNMSQRRYILA